MRLETRIFSKNKLNSWHTDLTVSSLEDHLGTSSFDPHVWRLETQSNVPFNREVLVDLLKSRRVLNDVDQFANEFDISAVSPNGLLVRFCFDGTAYIPINPNRVTPEDLRIAYEWLVSVFETAIKD